MEAIVLSEFGENFSRHAKPHSRVQFASSFPPNLNTQSSRIRLPSGDHQTTAQSTFLYLRNSFLAGERTWERFVERQRLRSERPGRHSSWKIASDRRCDFSPGTNWELHWSDLEKMIYKFII